MSIWGKLKEIFWTAGYQEDEDQMYYDPDDIQHISERTPAAQWSSKPVVKDSPTIKVHTKPTRTETDALGFDSGAGTSFSYISEKKVTKMQIVKIAPADLEDATEISSFLNDEKGVIVNLEGVDPREGQRIMDFIGGIVHALDGHIHSVTDRVFALVPKNGEISEPYAEHLKASGLPSFKSRSSLGGRL